MSFAHPLFLWGALLALVPLLIHLFDRRRARPLPFGAIAFVLKSQRRNASRLRLRQILLFAARTLMLLAIPVALAKPMRTQSAGQAASSRGPSATAIVLDASLSMRYRLETSLFERGRAMARQTLRNLSPEEPATFMLCGPRAQVPEAPVLDRARVRGQMEAAGPSFGPSDLSQCLALAAKSLDDSPLAGKRLVVISDFTANALRLERPPPLCKGPKGEPIRPEMVLRDAAKDLGALPNHALVDLKIRPAPEMDARAFSFAVTAKNFSNEGRKALPLTLTVEGQPVATTQLDLPAGGTTQTTLVHRFPAGGNLKGEVALAPDALAEDDRRAFTLSIPRELRALVLNGAPNAVRYRDEAFFVDAALDAPGSPIREVLKDGEAGLKEDFRNYDVILLLNVPAPKPEDAARLLDFVRGGGGLFISMGDRVDPETYNERLGNLLPRPLRVVKTAGAPEGTSSEGKSARLSRVAFDHPLFSPFAGSAREGILNAHFFQYMLVEAALARGNSSEDAAFVLASYDDGAPAFLSANRGKGRVILYTSTVDRDWTDLPIRTSFLPLMQRLCAHLAGSLEEREELRARVGTGLTLRPPPSKQISQVKSPSGNPTPIQRQLDDTLWVGPLSEPGVYQPFDETGAALSSLSFAADLDPAASDLSRLRPEELSAYFGEEAVHAGVGEGERPSVPVWTWLIMAGALAFFFEGILVCSQRT